MKNLKITAHLRSPVIRASGYMTMDAILGAAIAYTYAPDEDVISRIPVQNRGGLFMASAAIFTPIHIAHMAVTGSMRAEKQINTSNIKLNAKGEIHADPFIPAYKPVMNSYIAITSPTVEWIVEGDREAIEGVVHDINFIGKRRASGYGEVSKWTVVETDLSPLIDANAKPLRPIPVNMFTGDRSLPVIDAAWMPPYWNPMNRAPCYAPSLMV
jgi:hypothetical protein